MNRGGKPISQNVRTRVSPTPFPLRVLGIAIGSFMAVNAVTVVSGASMEIDLENPLGTAQEAASSHAYEATLTTTWLSQSGLRTRRIFVRADGERVSISGERKLMSSGSKRSIKTGGGWHSLLSNSVASNAPPLTKKYVVKVGGTSSVAGRTTTQIVVADRQGRLRDLIDIDESTGMLLRREQRDESGQTLRITNFEKIDAIVPALDAPRTLDAVGDSPSSPLTVSAPFVMIKRLPGGFVLTGKYMAQGGGRELFYSDGLNSVSVFEWKGSIEPGSLPVGGTWRRAPNGEMRIYDSPLGLVAVWDAGNMTFTVVSEATALETAKIVAALPQDKKTEGLSRMRQFLIGPFSWG